jgi:tRNA G18 (ribose-2'-O)-methylase SpoU
MGTAFEIPIYESPDVMKDLQYLQGRQGLSLVATVANQRGLPLDDFQPPTRAAILFGSEGHGLNNDLVARCDHRVTIPMYRNIDSLNVAVAAGIVVSRFKHSRSA